MKLREIYETAVRTGFSKEMRPKSKVLEGLKRARKEFSRARGIDKTAFDKERIRHPYDDTRILFGDPDTEVHGVMVGIDIGVGEILLADRLREKGARIDLVISHHPSGRAIAGLGTVMTIQPAIWERFGVPGHVAEGIMKDRVGEVRRGISSGNLTQTADAARLLGVPLMCMHTAADNCVASYLQGIFDRERPRTLGKVVDVLKGMPEYREAMRSGTGPFILIGKEKDPAGKIFVDMTGGTSGPDKMFARLSASGVKTIVGMHCKETSFKVASSEFINYVIAGHISSDNLGMNLVFDVMEKKGRLDIVECSGFRRFRRKG
ncbi:MAG: NGG1p interacting factor NIF3 [Candidatus Omnitrophica bacterium]|nr:NGG1p interacting factor NIF3 [Candidatus Omnitrophota bacterium]